MRMRTAVIFVAKLHTNASLNEIGRALNRDHSAVQRQIGKAKGLWVDDPDFRALCGRITISKMGSISAREERQTQMFGT